MNIMSCRGFSKNILSTVILICHSARVPIYPYKLFIIVETEEASLDNVTVNVKKKIKYVGLYYGDSLLKCKTKILLIVNILHKTTIPRYFYDTCVSIY